MPAAPKIQSIDLSLDALFQEFYSVPDFQREYVWQPENVRKLLDDIIDEFGIENGSVPPSEDEYFIGSIVVYRHTVTGKYELIDGQQRLTTCYLVFCALRDRLRAVNAQSTALNKKIYDVHSHGITGEDEPQFRLDLQYEDSDHVLEKIAAGDTPVNEIVGTTESVKHLVNAYQTIDEYLRETFHDDPASLKGFYAAFSYRVKLIRIETPNLSHALKIFETINDRGVGLNAMDLLKNLLFMRVNTNQYDDLKKLWKKLIESLERASEKPLRFLRYYILANYKVDLPRGELREDQIYDWFQSNIEQTGIDRQPMLFLNELVETARCYEQFTKSCNAQGQPVQALANIAALSNRARQHFVLLLAGRKLPAEAFDALSRHLENLYFCYIITREPTKNFERVFGKWSPQVRSIRDLSGLEQFVSEQLVPELAARVSTFDFALGALSLDRVQKYRIRYVLAKMVDYIERAAGRTPPRMADLFYSTKIHIEHIFPRSLPLWHYADFPDGYAVVNRLGNLTLLEGTINTSVSDNPFALKLVEYPKSQYLLTSSIALVPQVGKNTQFNRAVTMLEAFDTWDAKSIASRQEMLRKLARQIWLPYFTDAD